MAISKQNTTYGLLNRWQSLLDISDWHFNQVAGSAAPFTKDQCLEVWVQPEREHIARALYNAVQKMTRELGFYPRPVYVTEDVRLSRGVPYQLQMLRTKYGKLITFGSRATSVISAGAAVVYSDADGDGVNDTATITVASGVSTTEVGVFFTTTDGAPSAAHERWEITPLTVTASGGNLIITGPRAYFVDPPTIWNIPFDITDPNRLEKNKANTTVAGDFVTTVDVYRVYTDTTIPAQLITDPYLVQNSNLGQSIATTADVRIVDAETGIIEVRASGCTFEPYEAVRLYYLAGQALVYNAMEAQLEEACIRLANTLMPKQASTLCDITWEMWAEDRSPMLVDNQVSLQKRDTDNPFGLLKGQIAAWHVVQDYRIRRGGKITMGIR